MSKITTIVNNIISKVNEHTTDVLALETLNSNHINLSGVTAYHLLQGNLAVSNSTTTQGFNTTLYTGNGSTQSITTGIDMNTQWGNTAEEKFGGLVWGKSRSGTTSNAFTDTIRGINNTIFSNLTDANSTTVNRLTAFNANGFSLGTDTQYNTSTATYASWNFQTTHRVTGTTNHGKAYECHYNPFTGFTMVKYTGSGIAGHEIPHHLGRKLGFVTVKNLSAVSNWKAQFETSSYLHLNLTDAKVITSIHIDIDNSLNILSINGTDSNDNASSQQYILYGWANSYFDKANKLIGNYEIGVYQGTGASGNKVLTRGKPAWVMIKRTDGTGYWAIHDNQRANPKVLYANTSDVEVNTYSVTFNVDGFTLNSTGSDENVSGGQHLYIVAYDTNANGGGTYYPLASDTANVQVNNALIPIAQGIDSNGSKNSIVVANETITGLTYAEGKNYLYKTDTGYGVKAYEPRYLASELVRKFSGEQPDYYDVESNKWFNCDAGSELVTNGKFDANINGITSGTDITASWDSGTLKLTTTGANTNNGAYLNVTTVIGKKYAFEFVYANSADYLNWKIDNGSLTSISISGKYSYTFIAQNTTTKIEFFRQTPTVGQVHRIDNISVFPTEIVPTTEITESRNYMNHIVHADADGGVLYVEELPKIEYKNIIKAEEYLGKNACTAYIVFDATTTVPTILDSYGILAIIRIGVGLFDIYIDMENVSYELKGSVASAYFGTGVVALTEDTVTPRTINKVRVHSGYVNSTTNYTLLDFKYNSVNIYGGRN